MVSDTHGSIANLRRAVASQSTAEIVIHCGDGRDDLETVKLENPAKMFVGVKGNSDWNSDLPLVEELNVLGKRIFITHGHAYNVKYGEYEIKMAARDRRADVLLFGHTHVPFETYEDGLYIMNPGSLSGYRATYGTLDITEGGIAMNTVRLKG